MSQVIVFGGSGFIGRHLIARLVREGRHGIVSVDLRRPRDPIPGVLYLTRDVRDLSGLSFEEPIERIYNLSAVHTTPGHPDHEYYETNVLGAVEVTAFAERHGVRQIVFTSSISVYGPNEAPRSETDPTAPESAYGRSKFMAETIHRAWFDRAADRRLVTVRPAVIFGPGEGGNFTRLAKLLRKGFFIYPGRRDTVKACFHVDDLIDAIEYARSVEDRFVLFNGCYPDRYTIEDIIETFRRNHFPKVRTFLLPRQFLTLIATLLRPLSSLGLGIHPDRVMKLARSTDISPTWLTARGQAPAGRLEDALARWAAATDGRFD